MRSNNPLSLWVKFWRLPAAERRLLVCAAAQLCVARVAVWAYPFQHLIQRQSRQSTAAPAAAPVPPAAQRIAWAIGAVGRHWPGARNCLVQALAAQAMLAQRGYAAQLRIGVARNTAQQFQAHAWVEYNGHILIGDAGAAEYTPLPPLEAQRDER